MLYNVRVMTPTLLIALSTAALLCVVGCSTPAAPAPLTGDAIAASLQATNLPIANVQVFTADTDPNHLLGRPNQYTAKVSWTDTRLNPNRDPVTTVEVFPDMASMNARETYATALAKGSPIFAEYDFRNDNRRALLRLSHDLTPDQAAEYQRWLATL